MSSTRDILVMTLLFSSLYFEVFMLITYLESRKSLKKRVSEALPNSSDNLPSVTVIVPCYNEERTAAKTIESLLALDYPKDKLRILAINDGSTDGTRQAIEAFSGNPQIEIIHKENGGKHTVLNIGIKKANTELVGCLDADSYVSPDTLKRLVKRFDAPEIMAVVPSMHVHKAKTMIQKMQKVEYYVGVFLRSILSEMNAIYVTPGPFSIFRKSVFEKIGFYRKAHNTEDMEMALRMQANKMVIACANDAVVYTSSPETIKKLYKQRLRWTSGFLKNAKDYRFMILRADYGHVGGFILPFMLISIGGAIFTALVFVFDIGKRVSDLVLQFQAIGFKIFEFKWPNLDWFYTQTSPVVFAGLAALILMILFVWLGGKVSRNRRVGIGELLCYIFIYSAMAPIWIFHSLVHTITDKQTAWR